MLFNSYLFLACFLPAVFATFFALARLGLRRGALASLLLSSLLFYGWWNPHYVPLLLSSILFDLGIATAMVERRGTRAADVLLGFGVVVDLALLGYFKYAGFFAENWNALTGAPAVLTGIVLPLGISFYTFQQISFLVDLHRGEIDRVSPLEYALSVAFFPHLIAGPIVRARELVPQFRSASVFHLDFDSIARGLSIFIVGLFKKCVLANGIAAHSTPIFDAAANGTPIGFWGGWTGTLAYTFQLYFDFSGYSDMAVGLALFFGVRLPRNFDSPYQAASIIDFWRRWHMSLSRFLRDYVYVPLGGNRRGPARRYANLVVTMLLGGLWHGASWNTVAWGGIHATYLLVNHAWRAFRGGTEAASGLARGCGTAVTFLAVAVAWVPFRSETWPATERMFGGMIGLAGLGPSPSPEAIAWIVALGASVWGLPDTLDWVRVSTVNAGEPRGRVAWSPRASVAVGLGLAASVAFLLLTRGFGRESEFLYFQF